MEGLVVSGRVTRLGFVHCGDRHGAPHRYEVITVKIERAQVGPKFEEHPQMTEDEVREALRESYERIGFEEDQIQTALGLPFLLLPTQLTMIPAVGDKVVFNTDGATPYVVEVSEAIVHPGIAQVLLQQRQADHGDGDDADADDDAAGENDS